jgi:transaldolase|tara:strand:+ start:822 stop:1511 length:690 start_codon:yes stop_codon:yes gene_type:complete
VKIFLDTADVTSILERFETGLIDGVTTNPSLIRKSGRDPEDVYRELAHNGIPDISMEVVEDMIGEGRRLSKEFPYVCTIKVPCTPEGLQACKVLSDDGVRVNVTLIFNAAQAILASKAGATYVSPFIGRLDDNSVAGLEVVRSISEVYKVQGVKTQILAASIRDVYKVSRSFWNGASVVTMPPKIFDGMYNHILTDKGLDIFDKDYQATKQSVFNPPAYAKHGKDLDSI